MATKKTGASKPSAIEPAAEKVASHVAEKASSKAKTKTETKTEAKTETKTKTEAPVAEMTPATQASPYDLANGRKVDMDVVRKSIAVYSPKAKIPKDDVAAIALLREVVAKRIEEVGPHDRMLCGELDDATSGCRELATADVLCCPFCGDTGELEDEAPPPASVVDAPPASATEAGLVVLKGELDEAVSRFVSLRRDLVANAYDIGLTLRDIRDRDLWKASGASSLKDFMEKELSISRTSGYRYMALTEEYDRKTFLEVGPKKLALISGIEAKEDRDAALDLAKQGASTRDVAALANPERGRAGREAPAKEATSKPSAPKKTTEITLLAKVGGKATVIPFRGAESGRPLKHFKPGAYGEFQISDDVVLRVSLKDDKEGNHEGISIAFVRAE